ncbi:PadR family transcriptional regulator [Halobacillus kuroshimensis]|uniref:PadR family transcriptional regulator n=1 Tax=Halobacillus kuroshimensis TaxID=302481 RepID=A0ABS3E144_9BACI|nr:PadR family transcriptional regulator [Halobacillus kuroshimensis]MBN8237203.1 PadR family transcriptional regulator [Halobacillus kuroshimensis]
MTLRYALLGLLTRKSQTGYELYQTFKQQLIYVWSSTHSQIYKELNLMEKHGLITYQWIYQEGSPNKKQYTISYEGEKKLAEWIVHEQNRPLKMKDQFLIKASSFSVISKSEAIQLLEEVKQREYDVYLQTKKWKEETFPNAPSHKKTGEYITAEFGIRYAKMYVDWCDWAMEVIKQADE